MLLPSIYIGVQDFFEKKYTLDAISVQNEEFFKQLKPRIQRNLLDSLFQNYYEKFKWIFEEFDKIDPHFKRDLFSSCKFTYCQNLFQEDEDLIPNDWPNEPMVPEVIKAGQISSKVYFILFGQIHVMSKCGLFEYSILSEGSMFGDISLLLNETNQFSYYYDPF